MKKAETMQALDAMDEVRTSGDLRRIVSNTLLALSRKEISATDVEVIAKGLDTISNSLNVEIKMARLDIDLKKAGLKMKSDAELGKLHIG
jgi:hypothetical protein